MLFEPCGDLRKDYGAFCEVLRRTEREDIYGAITTCTEQQQQAESRRRKAAAAAAGELSEQDVEDGDAGESSAQQRLSFEHTPPPPPALPGGGGGEGADATAAPTPEKPAPAPPVAAPPKGRKASRASTKRKSTLTGGGGDAADEEAQRALAEELQKPFVPPNFTLLELRYPTFCLNSRDMLPLTRAIPHCRLLASLKLVGCGLSVESYGQLVEAVYKNPNVVAVSVDFNDGVAAAARWSSTSSSSPSHHGHDPLSQPPPGFTPDPTIRPRASLSEAAATAALAANSATMAPERTGGEETAATSQLLSEDPQQQSTTSAAEASTTSEDPHALYLRPSEFCGLHLRPTQLEEQINEERERKGKVDPKKQQQLQQQNEALEEFDLAHRVRVPRAWYGLLYCGIRHLSLRGNAIDDAALRPIARLLQAPHSRLLSLSLWGNQISDAGASLLAAALQRNYTLRALDVGHNRIGNDGLLELIDVFRVAEVPTMEEVQQRRAKVLAREGASTEERAVAETAPPTVLPTYRDWYAVWWTQHHGAAAEEAAGAGGAAAGAKKEPPGLRKASSGRGKGGKGEAAPLRSTQPFDRDCVRVDDRTIRVPGNTVLEVLNLAENMDITLEGAREACRRLQLREPAPEDLPQAQQLPNPCAPVSEEPQPPPPTAAAAAAAAAATTAEDGELPSTAADGATTSTPPSEPAPVVVVGPPPPTDAVLQTPERYCTAMRLRTCLVGSHRRSSTALETWAAMAEVQQQIHAALDTWAPAAPHGGGGSGPGAGVGEGTGIAEGHSS